MPSVVWLIFLTCICFDQPPGKVTTMVKARKYVVTKRFQGIPKRDDFQIIEYELPPLQDNQILVKVEWVSVDPYLRTYSSKFKLPYDQFGYQVGIVQETKDINYPVGTRVVSHQGWCDYCIMNPNSKVKNIDFDTQDFGVYKLPKLQGLPISLAIGAIGIPGATAYFGLLEICKPEEGETVVVTAAAGAVGSIVGQIAKIKGCKVIGFTGSDEKVKWLMAELGFDKAFNYKTADISVVLREAAPDGIDCYFDNVGGELGCTILKQMKSHGRVAICGTISTQDDNPTNMFQRNVFQPIVMIKQLKVEGFLVYRWIYDWPRAFNELTDWIRSGKLKAREHVTEGFDKIVDAFVGMLSGENLGKAVVKVS